MLKGSGWVTIFSLLSVSGLVHATQAANEPAVIVGPMKPAFAEKLAAKEIRRYVYLRTGWLLPISQKLPANKTQSAIVVGNQAQSPVSELLAEAKKQSGGQAGKPGLLAAEQYLLKTIRRSDGRVVLVIAGGDSIGTLYGAYRLAEHLGVRFYLHGDVLPDKQVSLELPTLDEVGKPLFAVRGIQPFHDFPEGPDWWNRDDYKAVLGQLPKLRMNFFGLHTYPQGGVGPEPLVWIGRTATSARRQSEGQLSHRDTSPPAMSQGPGATGR